VQIDHDGEKKDDPARSLTVPIRNNLVVVHLPHHAMQRMHQRRVSDEDLVNCLKFPDIRNLPTEPGRKRIGRDDPYRHMRLDVVYEENADGSITVVSLFWVK